MKRLSYLLILSCVILQLALVQSQAMVEFAKSSYEVWENAEELLVTVRAWNLGPATVTVDIDSDGQISISGQNRVVIGPNDMGTADIGINLQDNQDPNPDIIGVLTLARPQVDGNDVSVAIGDVGSTTITIRDDEPVWGEWNDFSECSVTCGSGMRNRTRECIRPDMPDLDPPRNCEGDAVDIAICYQPSCPVAVWSSWTSYSECSVTCGSGNGTRTRTRTCNDPDPSDDVTCSGDVEETDNCTSEISCTGPVWSEWGEYSDCTVTCGGGSQTRSRDCGDPTNQEDGAVCTPGSDEDSRDCNTQACQSEENTVFFQQATFTTKENVGSFIVDVERTSYADRATVGIRTTGDLILNTDQIEFLPNGNVVKIQIYVIDDNIPEPDASASIILYDYSDGSIGNPGTISILIEDDDAGVPSAWTPWDYWSCDATCGIGTETRSRTCIGSSEGCIGDGIQNQICNTLVDCPEWGEWGQWSQCPSTCGSDGSRIRTRGCNSLGSVSSCQGSNTQSERCDMVRCPGTCESDVEITPYGRLRAPVGEVGSTYTSDAVCPWDTRNEGRPIAIATCVQRNGITFWDWIINCGGDKSTTQKCNDILQRPIYAENAVANLDEVCDIIIAQPNAVNAQCVSNVIDILRDVVALELSDREVTNKIIDVVDKLCLVDTLGLTSDAVKLLQKQLKVVEVERQDIGYNPYRRVTDNIATEVYWASNEELCKGLYVASSRGPGVPPNDLLTRTRQASTSIDAEIEVPPEICDRYPNGARVVLDVFASDKLLQSSTLQNTNAGQNRYNRVVNSPVISVTIGDQEIRDLEEPVRLLFTPLEIHSNNTQCVYWDCLRNDWSSEGCRYLGETPNWQRICDCDHLTSFAVIMDIYRDTDSRSFNLMALVIALSCIAAIALAIILFALFWVLFIRGRRSGAIRREEPRARVYYHDYNRRKRPVEKSCVIPQGYPRY